MGFVVLGLAAVEYPKQRRGDDPRAAADAEHTARQLPWANQVVALWNDTQFPISRINFPARTFEHDDGCRWFPDLSNERADPWRSPYLGGMTDEAEPRLYVNRWGDTSDPAPGRRGSYRDSCSCLDQSRPDPRARVGFHVERQDTFALGWQHLLDLVDEAVADGREDSVL